MPERKMLFGTGAGGPFGAELNIVPEVLRIAEQADTAGLDMFTLADHPYFAGRLDAYATLGIVLGRTSRITGLVGVTNLPSRPAPVLAHTITSLSALSGGRVVLGIGAGALWDEITKLGVRRLSPGAAVRAMEEAIILVRALSGGGDRVTFRGEFYQVSDLEPAPVPAPPVWTGSVGPKSLAVTGRHADGWIPPRGADWLSKRYRESRPLIDEAAASVGRDPGEIKTIYNIRGRITPGPQPQPRDSDGHWAGGSAGQWAEELTSAVVEHGADGFFYREELEHTSDKALRRWAEEIVPAVRDAVAKA
jgi:alkanesulfonate monooxygenase SsuD/methylene tetrahydromethanopterin reductase-like flavin-dependent oxidoreductase (luciferase family)